MILIVFLQSKNFLTISVSIYLALFDPQELWPIGYGNTIAGVSPKYYSICHNWVEAGVIYPLQWFLEQERSNCFNCKTC
jgi:hypothetical protein